MKFSTAAAILSFTLLGSSFAPAEEAEATKEDKTMPKPEVVLDEEDWKKRLTLEQFSVTRRAGTERPFGEVYKEFEAQGEGTYYCVCCGAELFTSNEKFHSGCGWPSFYESSKAKNVLERADESHGMVRIETVCKRCHAHLGHVFEGEGYKTPTDRRFCINGVALKYVPAGGEAPPLLELGTKAVEDKKAEVAKEGGVEVKD